MKARGSWMVDADEFTHALEHQRRAVSEMKQATAGYAAGILRGRSGETVVMELGVYKVRGAST